MDEADELYEMVKIDPERAWPRIVAYVREHPESPSSTGLIEELVYRHDIQFISRLEATALEDPTFRQRLEQAYVGGDASDGAEQFWQLQERLRSGWYERSR